MNRSLMSSSNDSDEDCFNVTSKSRVFPATEQDVWSRESKKLSAYLRERPTLPASSEDPQISFDSVDTAIRLPLFSCPFRKLVNGNLTFQGCNGRPFQPGWPPNRPTRRISQVVVAARLTQLPPTADYGATNRLWCCQSPF